MISIDWDVEYAALSEITTGLLRGAVKKLTTSGKARLSGT
jgi:hypothetical protein